MSALPLPSSRRRRRTWRPPTAVAAFLLVALATTACTPPDIPSVTVQNTGGGNGGSSASSASTTTPGGTTSSSPSRDGSTGTGSSAACATTRPGGSSATSSRDDDDEPSNSRSAGETSTSASPTSRSSSTTEAPTTTTRAPAEQCADGDESSSRSTTPPTTSPDRTAANAAGSSTAGRPSGASTTPAAGAGNAGEAASPTDTLFVSTSGNDNGRGTQADPFKTIQKAVDQAGPGVEIRVAAGNYPAPNGRGDVVTIRKSGTAENPIRLRGEGQVALEVNDDTFNALKIEGNHIEVRNISVQGKAGSISRDEAFAQRNRNNPRTNMNCVVAAPPPGNPNQHPTHIKLIDIEVDGCPGTGIGAQSADYITIEGCTVTNSSTRAKFGNSPISFFLLFNSDDNRGVRNIVRGCTVRDNRQEIADPAIGRIIEGHGFIADRNRETGHTGQILIEDNVFENNGGFAVNCFKSDNCKVRNNRMSLNVTNIEGALGEAMFNQTTGSEATGNVFKKDNPKTDRTIHTVRAENFREEGNREE